MRGYQEHLINGYLGDNIIQQDFAYQPNNLLKYNGFGIPQSSPIKNNREPQMNRQLEASPQYNQNVSASGTHLDEYNRQLKLLQRKFNLEDQSQRQRDYSPQNFINKSSGYIRNDTNDSDADSARTDPYEDPDASFRHRQSPTNDFPSSYSPNGYNPRYLEDTRMNPNANSYKSLPNSNYLPENPQIRYQTPPRNIKKDPYSNGSNSSPSDYKIPRPKVNHVPNICIAYKCF